MILSVRNGGDAIPPEALPTLFAPFRRGTERSQGLGLGLYIVSEIVRSHAGTIDVTSSTADGTEFRVSLPRSPEQNEAQH